MPPQANRARLLAPVALLVFGFIFIVIVFTSGGGNDNERARQSGEKGGAQRSQPGRTSTTPSTETTTGLDAGGGSERVYVVKAGDSLAVIAESTGVSVETIEELNPDLDPRALVTGQKIKLR